MAQLTRPETRLHASFLAAMEEFREEGRAGEDSMIGWDFTRWGATWESGDVFAAYVRETIEEEHRPRAAGFVCQTNWWWTDRDEYVGRISLRHGLTPGLREWGGHIGYDVRRSRRRQGHATRMLAAVLAEAHSKGIDPALLTCDVANVGSRKVIEANGGELEDQRGVKLRYWVPTAP